MARYKVVALLSRRYPASRGVSSNWVPKCLVNGSCRNSSSGSLGSCTPRNGTFARGKNWLLLGASVFSLGGTRAIHGSAYMAKSYYDILGVSKSASPSEIKKAFYAAAKEVHPDVNKEDPEAAKKMQEIQEAYEILKDDEKRGLYDQLGHDAFQQQQQNGGSGDFHSGSGSPFGFGFGFGFDDVKFLFKAGGQITAIRFFNMNPFGQKVGGQDAQVAIEISFMEAVKGCTKTITFQTDVQCQSCHGEGIPPGVKPQTCKRCRGTGTTFSKTGFFSLQMTCNQCGGTGKTVSSFCRSCQGHKVVKGSKTVKLDIMAGVDDNETIKVPRSGGVDPDSNQPGDLFVTLRVRQDPIFRREGSNIHVDAVLSITQAILGGTVQVPTLTGSAILKVRPGTQPGQKVVLKNKGIKARGSYSPGDQFVHFNVSIPTTLTPRQRELIEEFAKEEQGEAKNRAAGASG